jgi:hypothetical protein
LGLGVAHESVRSIVRAWSIARLVRDVARRVARGRVTRVVGAAVLGVAVFRRLGCRVPRTGIGGSVLLILALVGIDIGPRISAWAMIRGSVGAGVDSEPCAGIGAPRPGAAIGLGAAPAGRFRLRVEAGISAGRKPGQKREAPRQDKPTVARHSGL